MTKAPKTMRMVPKARYRNRIFRPCTREIQMSARQQIEKESGRTHFLWLQGNVRTRDQQPRHEWRALSRAYATVPPGSAVL